MFSAISGLRGNQVMMDVIGNNIANVNTVGFKSGRVNFQDILSQTLRGAAAPNGGLGSINPAQIGLGMTVAGIDVLQSQGNLQTTGKLTDMAIQGDGFFVLTNGNQPYYTRDGAFDIAVDGSLVNPASGLKVQGWPADASGVIDTTIPVGPLSIPIGQRTTAQASGSASIRGNLDAGAADGTTATTTLSLYDSLGVAHSVKVTFTKAAANSWTWDATTDPLDPGTTPTALTCTGTIDFLASGVVDPANPPTGVLSIDLTDGAVSPLAFDTGATPATFDLSQMTQFSGASEPVGTADGFASGTLVTFAVGNSGEITGVYTNGQTQALGQVALASFLNPAGLLRAGQSLYSSSSASGNAALGRPGSGSRGTVTTGALEMSNVDLATQFTGMITAQRGFQANGRVITTSDEMLQDLVNLKR
jgi:flagellar hook protein FlgE